MNLYAAGVLVPASFAEQRVLEPLTPAFRHSKSSNTVRRGRQVHSTQAWQAQANLGQEDLVPEP